MPLRTELKQLNALCFRLNAADWKMLCAELACPAPANDAMKRALRAVPGWEANVRKAREIGPDDDTDTPDVMRQLARQPKLERKPLKTTKAAK